MLTSIGLNIDAATARLAGDAGEAATLLGHARHGTSQAIADLRVLVHGLRPPAIDDLGLVGALRAQTERLTAGAGLKVDLEVDAHAVASLPAAVEVVVYRAVVEAVTNTARHAHATRCRVRIGVDGTGLLSVVVTDDGHGCRPDQWAPGVGLTSMRERAEELGGTLTVAADPAGGAEVAIAIPVVQAVS